MKKRSKSKKLTGVIFQSGSPNQKTDEQLANTQAQQKSIDADTYRKKVGSSESLNPSPQSLGPERW